MRRRGSCSWSHDMMMRKLSTGTVTTHDVIEWIITTAVLWPCHGIRLWCCSASRIHRLMQTQRRGEQLKWSLAFRLYIGSFVFHVHSYQDQFIQPGWAECFFCIFSLLGLCFVCSFVFLWFVCVSPSFCFSLGSWVISLTVLGARVTNLNEPPRALATSTIMWVRS